MKKRYKTCSVIILTIILGVTQASCHHKPEISTFVPELTAEVTEAVSQTKTEEVTETTEVTTEQQNQIKDDSIIQMVDDLKEKDLKPWKSLEHQEDWFLTDLYHDENHYLAVKKDGSDSKLVSSDLHVYQGFIGTQGMENGRSYCSIGNTDYFFDRMNQILYRIDEDGKVTVLLKDQDYINQMIVTENGLYVLINGTDSVIKKIVGDGQVSEIARGSYIMELAMGEDGQPTYSLHEENVYKLMSITEEDEYKLLFKSNDYLGNYCIVKDAIYYLDSGRLHKVENHEDTVFNGFNDIRAYFLEDERIYFLLDGGDMYAMDLDFSNLKLLYHAIKEPTSALVDGRIMTRVDFGTGYYDLKDFESSGVGKVNYNYFPTEQDENTYLYSNPRHLFGGYKDQLLYLDSAQNNFLIADNIELTQPEILIEEPIKWYQVVADVIYYTNSENNNLYRRNINQPTSQLVLEDVQAFEVQGDRIYYVPISDQEGLYAYDEEKDKSNKIFDELVDAIEVIGQQIFYIAGKDHCLYVFDLETGAIYLLSDGGVDQIEQHKGVLYVAQTNGAHLILELDMTTMKLKFHHMNNHYFADLLFDGDKVYSVTMDEGSFYLEGDDQSVLEPMTPDYVYGAYGYFANKYYTMTNFLFQIQLETQEIHKVTDIPFEAMIPNGNKIYLLNNIYDAYVAVVNLDDGTLTYLVEPEENQEMKYQGELIDGKLSYKLVKRWE